MLRRLSIANYLLIDSLDLDLSKADKFVIDCFTDRVPAESKKLQTDGKRLDGLWMGGSGIAEWVGDSIRFNDLGSKAAQSVQRALRKMVPAKWLTAATTGLVPVDADEKAQAKKGLCIWQTEYGMSRAAKYCSEKATDGYLCAEHAQDYKDLHPELQ